MAGTNLVVLVALFFATVGHSSGGSWCICKDGNDAVLQKTLDYACGAGADCTTIHQTGACYNPNSVRAHCNYAVNSYFQKKGQSQGSCDFAGTASIVTSDPSSSGCVYPSSASASTTPTPVTTTPSTTTPSSSTSPSTTTTPLGGSPYVTSPIGILGPSGTGINTDVSEAGMALLGRTSFFSFLIAPLIVFSRFMLFWG